MRPLPARLLPCALAACALAAPAHAQPSNATELSGRWAGTYACSQGSTSLELHLRGNAHGMVRGTFRFGPTPANPSVARGSYPVIGRYTGTTLALRPIDPAGLPAGYVPVGILATVTGRRMAGVIEGPDCGAVDVSRAEAARPRDPLPGGYGQQRWAVAADVPDGRLYLDARPRPTPASVRPLWMRWETLRDLPESGLRAGQVLEWEVELDCGAGLVRTWHALAFDADGELTSFDGSMPFAWDPIADGSLNQLAAERVCGGGKDPVAERP